jgi:hypothetical protein
MISACYSKDCDSRGLFESLKTSKSEGYEDKLDKYNVIKVNLNSKYQNTLDKGRLIGRRNM